MLSVRNNLATSHRKQRIEVHLYHIQNVQNSEGKIYTYMYVCFYVFIMYFGLAAHIALMSLWFSWPFPHSCKVAAAAPYIVFAFQAQDGGEGR